MVSNYETWQLDTYNNILPELMKPFETVEDDARKIEQHAELEILNHET